MRKKFYAINLDNNFHFLAEMGVFPYYVSLLRHDNIPSILIFKIGISNIVTFSQSFSIKSHITLSFRSGISEVALSLLKKKKPMTHERTV